jgi:hypothetical protein
MATSDKKPPTWQCVNGHRQPWGEDVRPAWIEAAQNDISRMFDMGCSGCLVGDIIERHWRSAK